MMLQDLFNHAMEQQWFALSYRAPLQTYIKKYARALGYEEAKSCPPQVYHQPDPIVSQKIVEAADEALQPRSVQARVNAILKLLHRAVAEGCLPALERSLVSWSTRVATHGKHVPRHRARGKDNKVLTLTPYGLRDWPLELAHDTAMYLLWCRDALDGAPYRIQKGQAGAYHAEMTVGQIAGYVVDVRGEDKERLTLAQLCDPSLLKDFTRWWVARRERWTDTIFNKLGVMKTIARYWLPDEPKAQAIADLMTRCEQQAPARTRKVVSKRARELPLEELDRLAQSMNPLNEQHQRESLMARYVARWVEDPERYPLPERLSRTRSTTHRPMNLKYYAIWVERELIIRLLIHRPLRISNICEMQFHNLQRRSDGGYDIFFSRDELKNGKYLPDDEDGWRETLSQTPDDVAVSVVRGVAAVTVGVAAFREESLQACH